MSSFDIDQLRQPEFWEKLCPDLTVSSAIEPASGQLTLPLRDQDWQQCKDLINEDAYFAYDSWFDTGYIDRLASCLLYTSPSPRDRQKSRMPSSA